jgi:nitroreductase
MSSFSNPVDDIKGAKKISKLVAELQTSKGLSIEDREYLIEVLHPETRTNIGGSISELSDQEFIELLSKIKLNNTLSKEEKRILSSMDTEAANKVYKELLSSPKIHPNIRGRTSPRAYSEKLVSDEDLLKIFEAARWGASAFNEQPWRYIYASKKDLTKYNKLKSFLDPWNELWAKDAPVIAIAIRKKTFTYNGKPNPFSTHDLGMAQANLGFEAQSLGVSIHPMGGFFPEKIKAEFDLPDDYEPVTMMAMGYRGNVKRLPADMQEGELKARERKGLSEIAFEGSFGNEKSFKTKETVWNKVAFSKKTIPAELNAPHIHEVVAARASKRAFADVPVTEEEIGSILEAARWAPSAFNEQPWRFIYVTKENISEYEKFSGVVNEFNAPWATKAQVLILGIAKKDFTKNAKSNSFSLHDLGVAQGNIQLQAEVLGLNARQMGGINPEVAKELLNIPEGYEPVSVIAIGKKGSIESLPEKYREEEVGPRLRKKLSEIIIKDKYE